MLRDGDVVRPRVGNPAPYLFFFTEVFAAPTFHNGFCNDTSRSGSIPDTIAIADGLFTPGPAPRLIGGRDRTSGRVLFPRPDGDRYEAIELPRQGRIWSWTVQRFRPKTPPYRGPESFEPFAIGYVQLGDVVIVEGMLTGIPFEDLQIGLEVETIVMPFGTDAEGRTILTYAFTPSSDRASAHG